LMEGVMKIFKLKHTPTVKNLGKSGQRDVVGEGAVDSSDGLQTNPAGASSVGTKSS